MALDEEVMLQGRKILSDLRAIPVESLTRTGLIGLGLEYV